MPSIAPPTPSVSSVTLAPAASATSSTQSATFNTIFHIAVDQHQCDPALVRPDTRLADLGLDSLALMEFIFSVEDGFRLRLPEDRLDPREAGITLGDLCKAIDEHLAKTSESGAADAVTATATAGNAQQATTIASA